MAMAQMNQSDQVTATLEQLLRSSETNIVHFLPDAYPYIQAGAPDIGPVIQAMVTGDHRREGELAGLIDDLGGVLAPPPVSTEQQFLAFLEVGFLLPKLADARMALIAQYDQAMAAVSSAPVVVAVLQAHRAELAKDLDSLKSLMAPGQQ